MPELSELIRALLDPGAYPEPPREIKLMQTQMSLVFLADDYVYKVKKPVNFGFLDYTTLERRKFYCHREVELNRRLCPDAYLGVIPVTRQNDRITVNGRGEIIEYAVKMRRLPQDAMMNVLLAQNMVTPEMLESVAGKLAIFHRQAETSDEICAFGGLETVTRNTEENFTQTEQYIGNFITAEQHRHIADYTRSFIKDNAPLFQKRVSEGRIKDCHGDLHAAHICFCNNICIYDCIEFNDRFRYCDVASEVAFLAMDLDNYGRQDLSICFIETYVAQSQDNEIMMLLNFYKGYRAYVRGKVGCFQLDDPNISPEDKEEIRAATKGYFRLAESYIPG